jgi:GNAT superfamily N-acetyltransferase
MRGDGELVWQSNAAFFLACAARSPGGRVVELGGVAAGITPVAPERPVLNSVICPPGALDARAYEKIASHYAAAGVSGFTAWVQPDDEQTAGLLSDRGHVLDAQPRAMIASTSDVAGRPDVDGRLQAQPSPAEFAQVNDRAYGYPGSFERAMGDLTQDTTLHTYAITDGARPIAVGGMMDRGTDAHLSLMATLPEHRGRGHATAIIRHLAADAAERGRTTTTLIATTAGAPVYTRLGYRDVGWLDMWERSLSA